MLEPEQQCKGSTRRRNYRDGSSPEYGGYVEIRHYNGLRTVYANCYETAVNKGAVVKGEMNRPDGNSVTSAGSHLHFEVWDGEYAMDLLSS